MGVHKRILRYKEFIWEGRVEFYSEKLIRIKDKKLEELLSYMTLLRKGYISISSSVTFSKTAKIVYTEKIESRGKSRVEGCVVIKVTVVG